MRTVSYVSWKLSQYVEHNPEKENECRKEQTNEYELTYFLIYISESFSKVRSTHCLHTSDDSRYDSRVKAMEVDEKPKEDYGDIGGLEKQIQELIEAVVLPLTSKEHFDAIGIKPPKGISDQLDVPLYKWKRLWGFGNRPFSYLSFAFDECFYLLAVSKLPFFM